MTTRVAVLLVAAALGAQFAPPPRTLDVARPLPYFIAQGSGQSGFRSGDRQLAEWALQAWQRASLDQIRFTPAPEDHALIRVYWVEATGGQYGEMQPLSLAGRLGAAVYIRPDLDGLGDDIAGRASRDPLFRDLVVYLTCVHELGHAVGLAHTRDPRDIMYFFGYGGDVLEYFARYRATVRARRDLAGASPLSPSDIAQLHGLYPGSPS